MSAAENVAQGYSGEAAMHDGWMASPGHRANILGDFTDIGVAFLSAGGTTWGVQVFASYPGHTGPAAPAATSRPTPHPPATHRSQARPPSQTGDAAPADRGDDAFATWLWIGIPSATTVAAAVGGVVVLRSRGLIGRSTGRHSA